MVTFPSSKDIISWQNRWQIVNFFDGGRVFVTPPTAHPTLSLSLSSSRRTFLLQHSCSTNSTSGLPTYPLRTVSSVFKVQPKRFEAGKWEPPVDGDESEYDKDEWTSFSDSEEQSAVSAEENVATQNEIVEKREKEFVQEVELLLEPEEQAILHQHDFPVLSKILSPKWSSFHTLTSCEQIAFMDKLLENGYDIDAIDEDGFTTLHTAVVVKKEAVVMHLLRAGANPHVRDRLSMKMTPSSLDGATLLHFAVQVGSLKLVKLLLKYKVDVNLADDEGWTPLHVALQSRCRDIAKILLVNGADKTRRTKNGKTPLDLSLCFGKDFKSYDLAKLLKLVPAGMDF